RPPRPRRRHLRSGSRGASMRSMNWHLLRILSLGLLAAAGAAAQPGLEIDANTFGGLAARPIGPAVTSGRIAAIDAAASAGAPVTLFIGSAGGGVWRSKDG